MDRNYDILGIPETASVDNIKKAYKRLAFEHHPDRNHGDNAQASRFREITEAYRIISSQFGRKSGGQLNNKPLKTDYTPKTETLANPYFNFRVVNFQVEKEKLVAEKKRLVDKYRNQQAIEEKLISDKNEGLVASATMLGIGAGLGYCSFDSYKWENDLAGNLFLAATLVLGAAGIGLTGYLLMKKKEHQQKKDEELETLIRTVSR